MSSIEHLITVADLEKFPDDDGNRYELIEGEVYVSTALGIPHQFALQNLQVALVNFLHKNPIGRVVPGAGAVFSNFDAVIPDLVFVSNERWSWQRIVGRVLKADGSNRCSPLRTRLGADSS